MNPDWLADVRPGLVAALGESMPDLELVDRDLDLGDGRRVDLVGVEGSGRAVALLWVEADDDAAVLAALDARAWFVENRELLDGHFAHPRLDPNLPPRVVLIAERYSERLLARLAGLDPDALRCLELRRVSSQRNARSYLVPARLAAAGGAPEDPTGARTLMRALSPEAADLAERLLRRLVRVDDELDVAADGTGLRCTLDGEALCGLQARRGALLGWVGESEPEPLVSAEDGEAFVERVLRELRRLLPAPPPALGRKREAGAKDAPQAAAVDPFDPAAPLLSPEEIAAFQEP